MSIHSTESSATTSLPQFDRGVVYESLDFEEALARIEFTACQRRSGALVTGEPGTGKTLLLGRVARLLRRQGIDSVYINAYGISDLELLWLLNSRFASPYFTGESRLRLWRGVQDRIDEYRCTNQPVVLLVDHADQASGDVQSTLLRLTQIDATGPRVMTTVFAAESKFAFRITPRLLDVCELQVELGSWSLTDTIRYLELLTNSKDPEATFLGDAAVRLIELTRGNPRRITQLADLARLAILDQASNWIDAAIIDNVYRELSPVYQLASPVSE